RLTTLGLFIPNSQGGFSSTEVPWRAPRRRCFCGGRGDPSPGGTSEGQSRLYKRKRRCASLQVTVNVPPTASGGHRAVGAFAADGVTRPQAALLKDRAASTRGSDGAHPSGRYLKQEEAKALT